MQLGYWNMIDSRECAVNSFLPLSYLASAPLEEHKQSQDSSCSKRKKRDREKKREKEKKERERDSDAHCNGTHD